ncbi:SRPBCC family protein [Deinococcus cellulosilyticus]|uniref:Cyclase n=1 Tax=Deinococcus cellulosilyticus (strain DSM 18568 / NBRC 106333 / KACC 11606 / 5516J-15) TaxID=1223518 RepID=A0A511MW93_DEIC1|nr:SRPBCC family protein [Deinococcus cellulosilyticus]GEM44845.1 cyclase [Deinococcus cellulosilyticus NBRC 106333 = KACC 11606]
MTVIKPNTQRISSKNASPAERIVIGSLGAGLILLSLKRSGRLRALMGSAGALMVSSAAMGKSPYNSIAKIRRTESNDIKVDKAVTIGVPVEQLYAFWRKLENLPRFMSHLEEVKELDETKSHWVAKAPAGTHVSWDAEIVEDVPSERIAWRSVEGSIVPNEGYVEFKAAPQGRGTEVRVSLIYHPPAGTLGAGVARLFGEEPAQQVEHDLRRLKRLLEVGIEPTTEGQPSGRKSMLTESIAKMFDSRRTS